MSRDYGTNELIDFNLNHLMQNNDVFPKELRDLENRRLDDNFSEAVFYKMQTENLVYTDSSGRIRLATAGYDILDYGGWIKFKTDSDKEREEQVNKSKIIESLTTENLKSQNESLEYSKTIREQEEKIRKLTLLDLRTKTLFSMIGFLAGIIVGNYKEIYDFYLILSK